MNAWTTEEPSEFEAAEELEIASVRLDGTLRKPTTIWVVRLAATMRLVPRSIAS